MNSFGTPGTDFCLNLNRLLMDQIKEFVVSQSLFSNSMVSQNLIFGQEIQYDIEGVVILKTSNNLDEGKIIDALVSDGVPFDAITIGGDRFGFRPGEGVRLLPDIASSDDLLVFSHFEVPQAARQRSYF